VPDSVTHATLRNFAVDRTSQATSGYGVKCGGSTPSDSPTTDGCIIDDVWSQNSAIGFFLGCVGYNMISHCRAQLNGWRGDSTFAANGNFLSCSPLSMAEPSADTASTFMERLEPAAIV